MIQFYTLAFATLREKFTTHGYSDSTIYRKYKSIRNKVRSETRKLQKEEQRQVASQCKDNPKLFWKFVNGKRKMHEHIGDLKAEDSDGN